MSFGLDEFSGMASKRDKMTTTKGIELPEGNIADVQDCYKYLGVPQTNSKQDEAARKSVTTKNLQRERVVKRSQVNGKDKV